MQVTYKIVGLLLRVQSWVPYQDCFCKWKWSDLPHAHKLAYDGRDLVSESESNIYSKNNENYADKRSYLGYPKTREAQEAKS